MKKLVTLFVLAAGFMASSLSAADSAGSISWKVRADITDPEMKKQMEESRARMSDPETQAQMKAAQEAMNSPEMQEMMKSNPQMRAMMEKQMKALSKPGAGMDDLFPKSFTLHFNGTRSLLRTEGGMAAGDVLTLADKNVSYLIDREARTYQTVKGDAAGKAEPTDDKFKVTATGETTKVLGYTCKKHIVEMTEGDAQMTYNIWATNDIKGLDARALKRMRMGRSENADFFGKIEGVPLKMEITTPQMKMHMEATEVKTATPPESLFALPNGFKELAAQ